MKNVDFEITDEWFIKCSECGGRVVDSQVSKPELDEEGRFLRTDYCENCHQPYEFVCCLKE